MTKLDETKHKKPSRWYVIAAWALWGAVVGYVGSDIFRGGGIGQSLDVDFSTFAAVMVGMILIFCMAVVAFGFTFPKMGIAMQMFEDIEQWEDERTMMRLSCVGGGAYGVALVLLALAEPTGMIRSLPLLAALGVLAVIFTYASVRLLREYDELWQGVNSETSVISFYLTLIFGGVWSTLAHLDFIPALAPLDWITLMSAACLVGAIVATRKRGMLEE